MKKKIALLSSHLYQVKMTFLRGHLILLYIYIYIFFILFFYENVLFSLETFSHQHHYL